jgi:hypothetical protein
MTVYFDTSENFHPFECDKSNCRHCKRLKTEDHDPGTCSLCDPEYDYMPNPYWEEKHVDA